VKAELLNRRQMEAGRRFADRSDARRAHIRRIEKGRATPLDFPSPDLAVRELQIGRFGDVYGYARLLGGSNWVPSSFLERGVRAAKSVARLAIRSRYGEDEGFATGFLVAPGILLTTWSVLPNRFSARYSLAEFSLENDERGGPRFPVTFELDPETLFLSDEQLDFALVALAPESYNGVSATSILPLASFLDSPRILVGESVSLIDHPGGRSKQIAIRAHRLMDSVGEFFHYALSESATPGAPVFNDQWELVGLQRMAIPRVDHKGRLVTADEVPAESKDEIAWEATEAVRLSAIIARLSELELDEDVRERLASLIRPPAELGGNPLFDGYDPLHLGDEFPVYPPMVPLSRIIHAWRSPSGEAELRYPHFSVVGDRRQKHAIYVATNLSAKDWHLPDELALLLSDPRIPESEQVVDDELDQHDAFALVRARDISWGTEPAARANGAAHRPALCLGGRAFGAEKWQRHADFVLRRAVGMQKNVTVFSGPVDPEGQDAVPREFWRIVVTVSQGKLVASAFLFTMFDALGRNVGSWRLFECSVEALQAKTGLDFGILVEHDWQWGAVDYWRVLPNGDFRVAGL
jgi:endonuclease G, mitochondrial